MSIFVIGDIHGNLDALLQCIERSGFNQEQDTLISLGDICDGKHQTKQLIDYLLTSKNFILCAGNHDSSVEGCGNVEYGWALGWMLNGKEIPLWWHQGGMATALSYDYNRRNVPQSHINLLKNARPYYIDENNNLFVHGGYNPIKPIEEHDREYLMWDRDLAYAFGRKYAKDPLPYRHVFLGHTSTQGIAHSRDATEPITHLNVTCLDTGGGWNGKLTIMDVETLEYWQSDLQSPE